MDKKEKSRARKKKSRAVPSEMKPTVQKQSVSSHENSGHLSSSLDNINAHSSIQGLCSKGPMPDINIQEESMEVVTTDNSISESSSYKQLGGATDRPMMKSTAPEIKSAPSAPSCVQAPEGSVKGEDVPAMNKKKKKKKRRHRSRSGKRKRSLEAAFGPGLPLRNESFVETTESSTSRRRSMQSEFAKLTARAMLMAISQSQLSDDVRRISQPFYSQSPGEPPPSVDGTFSTKERVDAKSNTLSQTVIDKSRIEMDNVRMEKEDREKTSDNKEPHLERLDQPEIFSTKDSNRGGKGQEKKEYVYSVRTGGAHVVERNECRQQTTQASSVHTDLPSDTSSSSSESSSGDESGSSERPLLNKPLAQTGLLCKQLIKMPNFEVSSHSTKALPTDGKSSANGNQTKVKKIRKVGVSKCVKKKDYKLKTKCVPSADIKNSSKATKQIRKKLYADVSKLEYRAGNVGPMKKVGMSSPFQNLGSLSSSPSLNETVPSKSIQERTKEHINRKKIARNKTDKVKNTQSGPSANDCQQTHVQMGSRAANKQPALAKLHHIRKEKHQGTGKGHLCMEGAHTCDVKSSSCQETDKITCSMGSKKSKKTMIANSQMSAAREEMGAAPLQSGVCKRRAKNKAGLPRKKSSDAQSTVKLSPSSVVTKKHTSNVTNKEGFPSVVDTNRSLSDISNSNTTDIGNCTARNTENIQCINSTAADGNIPSSTSKQRLSPNTASIQDTISGTKENSSEDTAIKHGHKFQKTESDPDTSTTSAKDDSCIILPSIPRQQQESILQGPPTSFSPSVFTSTNTDSPLVPKAWAKASKNLHYKSPQATKEVSVQLTRLEDEFLYLKTRSSPSEAHMKTNVACTSVNREVQVGKKLNEANKEVSDNGTSLNKTIAEGGTKEDSNVGNTVTQPPEEGTCLQSVLTNGVDPGEAEKPTFTGDCDAVKCTDTCNKSATSILKSKRSLDSIDTNLDVSTSSSNNGSVKDICPHLPQNSCPQCFIGSESEDIEEETVKSNISCPAASDTINTQEKTTAFGGGASTGIKTESDNFALPTSVKIGDVSYTMDVIDLTEETGNTDDGSEEEETKPPGHGTSVEGMDMTGQVLSTGDDNNSSLCSSQVIMMGKQQDNPCKEERERRAHLEETIQKMWDKSGFNGQTYTNTNTDMVQTLEDSRARLITREEADDITDGPVSLEGVVEINTISSCEPVTVSGIGQNIVHHSSNKGTEDSVQMADTDNIGGCASSFTATSLNKQADESQLCLKRAPRKRTPLKVTTTQAVEDFTFSSQESLASRVELFANMFIHAIYGKDEEVRERHQKVFTSSSSDSEDSTGSETVSETEYDSEDNSEENDLNAADNHKEVAGEENDRGSTAEFQRASIAVLNEDGNVGTQNFIHRIGQSDSIEDDVGSGWDSQGDNSSQTSQQGETDVRTEYNMNLHAVCDVEDVVSDDDSSTYSFVPGDHSQGTEVVEEDAECFLESCNISPIMGSAHAIGATEKTCRRSLFEDQDTQESFGCKVISKEEMQEDDSQNLKLILNASTSSVDDWPTPLKPLVADYSSPGDMGQDCVDETTVEVFRPFSQDAEGDQLLADYMLGIEPILHGDFEPTEICPAGEEAPAKEGSLTKDCLSRDLTASDKNILEKETERLGTPKEGKCKNCENTEVEGDSNITRLDGVQEALSANTGKAGPTVKPTASEQATMQKRHPTLFHDYSNPQLLQPRKRQAKEEAIQKLTAKGRKDQRRSSSIQTTVKRGESSDHSYSRTSKQDKRGREASRQSLNQHKNQGVTDGHGHSETIGQEAQSHLLSKIQELSGSHLVRPVSAPSSEVEARPKRTYLVAVEKGPKMLPSGLDTDRSESRLAENNNLDATQTRNSSRAQKRTKKSLRMAIPSATVSKRPTETLMTEQTDLSSPIEDTDTMDNVVPPSQTDDRIKKKYLVSPRGAQGKRTPAACIAPAKKEVQLETQDRQTATLRQVEGTEESVQLRGTTDDEHCKGATGKRLSHKMVEKDEASIKKRARMSVPGAPNAQFELFHVEKTRGMFGWEDSLRQRLSPVKRFQPEAPSTADDKGKKRKKDEQDVSVKKKAKAHMQPLEFTTIRSNPATSPQTQKNAAVAKDVPGVSAASSSSAPVMPGASSTNTFPADSTHTSSQEDLLPEEYKNGKYGIGELVFGKLKGYTWWPGRVVSCVETGRDSAPDGSCWVRWFGDGKFSIVQVEDKLEPFGKFSQLYHERTYNRLQTYKRAILESLQVAADRVKKKFLSSPEARKNQDQDTAMVQWALKGFPPGGPESLKPSSEEAKPPDHLVHQWLQARQLKQLEQAAAVTPAGALPEGRRASVDSRLERAKLIEDVLRRQLCVDQLCLACGSLDVVTQHPLFRGGLCEGCRIEFLESSYQFDEDGYQSYCSLCAAGTEVLMCGQDSCCRSFCKDCLDLLVGPGTADQAVLEDPWTCYMCREEPTHGLLHRQQDWSLRLQRFFAMDDVEDFGQPKLYPPVPPQQRRPIRVLSLFDGIGTALLVLKELGVTVDVCYASEIDPDAVKVSQLRHTGGIRHLGNIRSIRTSDVQKLGPFDLVIGGSPCNDLSIANPNRAGLYAGTGVMFFHFYRLLQSAAPAPGDARPFFWLFENVVAMKHQYKQDISLFLGCNPVVVDAKDVSPAHRARYFWGNLPGMSRPLVPQASDKLALQQCLELGCGRVAQVKKVRTVTTTLHSVRNQGKQQTAPVLMEGEPDTLWCTELERLFGFPSHYTDVCNMSRCSRQRLLGRAWSIPVIRHLLAPLKDYFQCQDKK